MSKILGRVFILLFSFTVSVWCLEYMARYFFPEYDPSGNLSLYMDEAEGLAFPVKNSRLRHHARTGDFDVQVDINQYGFRDRKDLRLSGTNDFFVVGDSFSFGWGVKQERIYSERLQDLIKRPVYNISLPNNLEGYRKLIEYAQKQGANIRNLIIGVCMENDLIDYELNITHYIPEQSSFESITGNLRSYIETRSAIYIALATFAHQNSFVEDVLIKLKIMGNPENMNKAVYSENIVRTSVNKLIEIEKIFRSFVVIIPSRGLWIGKNIEVENRLHREFVKRLKRSGMEIIDLRAHFEEGGNPLQYHFARNPHWNEKGHAKAAEKIASYISNRMSNVNSQ